jgi:hypothetical protein
VRPGGYQKPKTEVEDDMEFKLQKDIYKEAILAIRDWKRGQKNKK